MMMAKKSPNPTDQHVGAKVRSRRLMLAMSQEKLGNALGLTFQQVQKYEKGANRIGASRLQHIANVLQVPVTFFFDGGPSIGRANGSPSPDYVRDFISSKDGIKIAEAFQSIKDAALRRQLVSLIEKIAQN